MKKLLFLLPYFLLFLNTSAQPYRSMFGHDSTNWTVEWANLDMFGAKEVLSVRKDTVIDGLTYKKLDYLYPGPSGPCFLREDTTTGKVWFRYLRESIHMEEEELAYDFSLNVGDSFNASNMNTGYDSSFIGVVDSVTWKDGRKYIYLNYRYYYWNPTEMLYEPITFIEGIGTNMGPAWKQYHGGYRHQYLMCSTLDGEQSSYRNIHYDGDCPELDEPPSSTHEPKGGNILQVTPNPAYRYVLLSGMTQGRKLVRIFTVEGKCIASHTTTLLEFTLDVEWLHSGLYIVAVEQPGKPATKTKLVIIK
jgi:hypothetical protein